MWAGLFKLSNLSGILPPEIFPFSRPRTQPHVHLGLESNLGRGFWATEYC